MQYSICNILRCQVSYTAIVLPLLPQFICFVPFLLIPLDNNFAQCTAIQTPHYLLDRARVNPAVTGSSLHKNKGKHFCHHLIIIKKVLLYYFVAWIFGWP